MARRATTPGEVGAVTITMVRTRYRARARTRDAVGNIKRPMFTADTEQAAGDGPATLAAEYAFGCGEVAADTMLTQLLDLWLADRRRFLA